MTWTTSTGTNNVHMVIRRSISTNVPRVVNDWGGSFFEQKEKLAVSRNTPAHLLSLLANEEDFRIRVAVAQNINTPIETLELLSEDDTFDVKTALLRNPALSEHSIELMEKNFVERYEKHAQFARILQPYITNLLFHQNCPERLLDKYSESKNSAHREAVAENIRTSVDALIVLLNDKTREVIFSAASNPKTPTEAIVETAKNMFSPYIRKTLVENYLMTREPYSEYPTEWVEAEFGITLGTMFINDVFY